MSISLPSNIFLDSWIKAIWSQSSSTDSIRWVEKITVAPSSLNCNISSLIKLALMGSNPENGSSKIKSLGWCKTVTTNWIFCAIPLESSSTFLSHQWPISNLSNQYFKRFLASEYDRPLSCAKYRACSPTFMDLYSPRSSGK